MNNSSIKTFYDQTHSCILLCTLVLVVLLLLVVVVAVVAVALRTGALVH